MLIVDNKAIQDISEGILILNNEVSALQNQIPNNAAAVVTASLFLLCVLRKHAPKFYLGVLTLKNQMRMLMVIFLIVSFILI